MKIGVTLPGYGANQPVALTDAARMAERMGFDSIWNTDHVVMVARRRFAPTRSMPRG